MKITRKIIIKVFGVLLLSIVIFLSINWWNKQQALKQEQFYKKGVSLLSEGNFEFAVKELEEATKLNPKDEESQRILGKAQEARGELDKAVESYEASLKANPNQQEVLYNLAVIYKSQGKIDEALEKLVKAVDLNKDFVAARLLLGEIYEQIGDEEKARREYQTVIDMNPFGVDIDLLQKKSAELKR